MQQDDTPTLRLQKQPFPQHGPDAKYRSPPLYTKNLGRDRQDGRARQKTSRDCIPRQDGLGGTLFRWAPDRRVNAKFHTRPVGIQHVRLARCMQVKGGKTTIHRLTTAPNTRSPPTTGSRNPGRVYHGLYETPILRSTDWRYIKSGL